MAITHLAEIVETKVTMAGLRKAFRCRLIERAPGRAVVLFVSERACSVGDVPLPAGTVTFGYFWADRGYNVYHWMAPDGATLAHYVNVSDGTEIGEAHLVWRDLTVDVLLRADGGVSVLDEHELPPDLGAVRAAIEKTKGELLAAAAELRAELEASSRALWPHVFRGERP